MGTSAGFGYTNTLKGIESIKALLRAQPWQLNNCIYAVEHLKLDLYTHRPNEVIAGRVYNHYITMYPARINLICAMCTIVDYTLHGSWKTYRYYLMRDWQNYSHQIEKL